MSLFKLAALILMLPLAVYFYFVLRRSVTLFLPEKHLLSYIIPAIIAGFLYLWGDSIWSVGVIFALYFAISCGLMDLMNKIIKNKAGKKWNTLWRSCVIPLVFTAVIISAGYINMHNVVRTEYNVSTDKPIERPLKIALISDLHLGINMDADGFESELKRIEAEEPDALIIAGDLFDESTTKENMEKACVSIGSMYTKYGAFYVYGNHDRNLYTDRAVYTGSHMKKCMEDAGITVLEDETVMLGESYVLVGQRDKSSDDSLPLSDVLSDVSENAYIICADHQPCYYDEKVSQCVDLCLSGHTHGGQIFPLGLLNATVFPNEMNYGADKFASSDGIHTMTAIVSSGMAGWGYPIRTEGHCEYVIINIK